MSESCLNLGSWGPSSLCPSLLPMVPSMPRLHDVSTSSTTLAQLSSTCHTPSQPWPMAWQTTCCVVRWKTSPQMFYNPHKSKQNLTTCSVWQKCTRPRHTSLYSPTRLTPPNTLRIQRLIQSNIPMFSSPSICQLHGFMLTVQHVFNNCGCENPYCDTVIYSAALMEVGTEKESLFLHDQDQEGWRCEWLKAKIHNKRNSKKRRNLSHIIVYHNEQCDL